MKYYYKRLSTEERKKVKKDFLASSESRVYKKARTIIIICLLGIILGIGSFIFDYVYKNNIINLVLDVLLFLFSLLFMIGMYTVQSKEINTYALNKKKSKK